MQSFLYLSEKTNTTKISCTIPEKLTTRVRLKTMITGSTKFFVLSLKPNFCIHLNEWIT